LTKFRNYLFPKCSIYTTKVIIYAYSKDYIAISEEHDKLLTSLRTAYTEELNLKKDQTSYSDLLDALRL